MERRDFLKLCRAAAGVDQAQGDREGTETMADLKHVTYCGLYCKLCANMARIPQQAGELRETLRREGFQHFGESVYEDFSEFWKVLEALEESGESCPGCRGGCGWPQCPMRKCAREKGLDVCSQCDEYPCEHVQELARRYPNLIADGMRQREVGLDRWIQEQEARRQTGFCYSQIRYGD